MISSEDLMHRFSYHDPDPNDYNKFEMIRKIALSYATVINEMVPDSMEKDIALIKLEEVVFWSNAGIARSDENNSMPE